MIDSTNLKKEIYNREIIHIWAKIAKYTLLASAGIAALMGYTKNETTGYLLAIGLSGFGGLVASEEERVKMKLNSLYEKLYSR